MNNTTSTGETLFSMTHPDTVRRTNVSSIVIAVVCCLLGAAAFIASLSMDDSSFNLSMFFLIAGTIFILYAVFRSFWQSKEWVYIPTGSAMKAGSCYFDVCDLQALTDVLKKKSFEQSIGIQTKTNGNVRMDYMMSKDKKFVAIQLCRFVPYTYEPVFPVSYCKDSDAAAFARCLEKGGF